VSEDIEKEKGIADSVIGSPHSSGGASKASDTSEDAKEGGVVKDSERPTGIKEKDAYVYDDDTSIGSFFF
jgi:hypothetical protein